MKRQKGFRKGRSGRFVPIQEHKAILARLAELEGKPVEAVAASLSPELAAKDAEIAGLREQLAKREEQTARAELKVVRGRVAELEVENAALKSAASGAVTDEGTARAEAILDQCMKAGL